MSEKRKTSSGRIDVPVVRLHHQKVEPEIRRVEQPQAKLVYWSRMERIGLFFDKLKPKKNVLKDPVNKAILQIIIFATKKLRKSMLQWIKDRLSEPSTYQGVTGLAGAIGFVLNPEMLELIATTVVGIISLIQMAKSEKLVEKKDE